MYLLLAKAVQEYLADKHPHYICENKYDLILIRNYDVMPDADAPSIVMSYVDDSYITALFPANFDNNISTKYDDDSVLETISATIKYVESRLTPMHKP